MRSFLPFRQIHEGTNIGFQALETFEHITSEPGHKPVFDLVGVIQLSVSIIPDDHGVKRISAEPVASDHELLTPVDSVLHPCTRSSSRLVDRLFAFGDDALEAYCLHCLDRSDDLPCRSSQAFGRGSDWRLTVRVTSEEMRNQSHLRRTCGYPHLRGSE